MNRTSLSRRVAHRHLLSRRFRTADVVHIDPLGHRWGWLSDEVQRLHLVPLAPEYRHEVRVWLEDGHGQRSFQIDRKPTDGSPLDLVELRDSVARARDRIEATWLKYSSLRGWLYRPQPRLIVLYPGKPFAIRRKLRPFMIEPSELQLEPASNRLYFERLLSRMIWLGRDDGSDAVL